MKAGIWKTRVKAMAQAQARARSALLALSLFAGAAPRAEGHSYEGQAHVQALSLRKPKDPDLFVAYEQNIVRATYRESGLLTFPSWVKCEYAVYLVAQSLSARDDLDHLGLLFIDPRHRTLKLDFHMQNLDRQDIYALVDRLNLRFNFGQQRLVVGRMAIDLSKSIIFRPNDIFAPSGFNNLDPYNKTGVDALMLSGPLAPLGEWKLLGVAGYEEQDRAQTDFSGRYLKPSNRLSAQQSSVVASFLNTWKEYAFQLSAGTYRNNYIVMASTEGEISDKLGLRIEGKQLLSRVDQGSQISLVLGLDYRFNETFLIVGEYYLNGEGLNRIEDFEEVESTAYQPLSQLGRHYLGLGLSYEYSPTIKLRSLLQYNLSDQSAVITGGVAYSLNEKIDLSLAFLSGQGAPPSEGRLASEYGVYPQALALEAVVRW